MMLHMWRKSRWPSLVPVRQAGESRQAFGKRLLLHRLKLFHLLAKQLNKDYGHIQSVYATLIDGPVFVPIGHTIAMKGARWRIIHADIIPAGDTARITVQLK